MIPIGGEVLGSDKTLFDDPLIDDHDCHCAGCMDVLALSEGERQDQYHASMRFKDNARKPKVLVDGKPVENRCYEAIGGEQGQAWCFRPNDWGQVWHVCKSCGAGPCMQLLTGKVEVIWGDA